MSSLPSYSRRHDRPTFDLDQPFKGKGGLTHQPFSLFGPFRAAFRVVLIVSWALFCYVIQLFCLILPINFKVRFPRVFWSGVCRILHLEVRQIGRIAGKPNVGIFHRKSVKPVLFVSNHTSWLDIVALGKLLPTTFISRADLRKWPLIGPISKSAGTIYISREASKTKGEVELISQRMKEGYNITLFPEGTTTSGTAPLPFHSSIFALACPHLGKEDKEEPAPLVQPISILFDRLEGLPVGRSRRASIFSWFGDMEFAPHVWKLLQWKHMRVTVMFHKPIDPKDFESRKDISVAAREIILHGIDILKQGRDTLEDDPLS